MRYRAVLLALVLLATSALSAQLISESVTVEVVDVPVFVSRGNNAVEGLTRDQFEVFVNGKRQPVEYFETVSAPAEQASLRDRRLFLLVFDVAFSHPISLPKAQRAAAQLIENAQPSDYFAVATYTRRRGVWFAAPFTRDRASLSRAIASLNSSRSGDPLAIVMTPAERESAAGSGSVAASLAAENLLDFMNAEFVRVAQDQIDDLAELSQRLAPLQGQKHVIMLSEGWDGRSPSTVNLASTRGAAPRSWGASFSPHLLDDLADMHRSYQSSGVFLHTLDIEGVASSFAANDGLFVLSEGTGGKFITNRNDLGKALVDLSSSLGRGYRLGFRPSDVKEGYNTIEVRVKNAGRVHVDYRRGFLSERSRAKTDDGVYLADVVLNDVPQTGTAAVLSLEGGTLTAQIPMRELAAQGKRAELLIYTFAADGSALTFHREAFDVTGDETKAFAIAVPEGTKVAKALLRVNGSLGFSKALL